MIKELNEKQKEVYQYYLAHGVVKTMERFSVSKSSVYYLIDKQRRYDYQNKYCNNNNNSVSV